MRNTRTPGAPSAPSSALIAMGVGNTAASFTSMHSHLGRSRLEAWSKNLRGEFDIDGSVL